MIIRISDSYNSSPFSGRGSVFASMSKISKWMLEFILIKVASDAKEIKAKESLREIKSRELADAKEKFVTSIV